MILRKRGYLELPAHVGEGGFDHAAVHRGSGQLYVAHTANDAVDVIDTRRNRYVRSISGLKGVAGVLVSEEQGLIFTSNRGEDSVSVLPIADESEAVKVRVGVHPNGLAYDPARNLLLAANVGDPKIADSYTVSFVDVKEKALISDVAVPGRTRWSLYDAAANLFYVNIRDPPQIAVIEAHEPTCVGEAISIPAAGPHGLDLNDAGRRLFCACDAGRLIAVDLSSGRITHERELSGAPDVVFFNPSRGHLYVAVGDPGMIDVFDTRTMERLESCPTEKGAHTIAFDARANRVYAFLPGTHRAAVYDDVGDAGP